MLSLLVEAGARVTGVFDDDGQSALAFAAAWDDSVPGMRRLLQAGADATEGWPDATALSSAADRNNMKGIVLLLACPGVDLQQTEEEEY
jgi:hypothetical protein